MPPHIFLDSFAHDALSGTMALHAHPTTLIDLTQEQAFDSDTGILHTPSLDTHTTTLHYWITTRSILAKFTQDRWEAIYNIIYFNPFSSKMAWTHFNPENPISNTIYVRRTKTTHPNFPSLASSMSTSPTPAAPPKHSSLSNPMIEPTTALIALIQQFLQQNAAMMEQIHSHPPLPLDL